MLLVFPHVVDRIGLLAKFMSLSSDLFLSIFRCFIIELKKSLKIFVASFIDQFFLIIICFLFLSFNEIIWHNGFPKLYIICDFFDLRTQTADEFNFDISYCSYAVVCFFIICFSAKCRLSLNPHMHEIFLQRYCMKWVPGDPLKKMIS